MSLPVSPSELQVQRIYDYHRLLVQLFSITSKDHPDYDDLRHTVARVQHVSIDLPPSLFFPHSSLLLTVLISSFSCTPLPFTLHPSPLTSHLSHLHVCTCIITLYILHISPFITPPLHSSPLSSLTPPPHPSPLTPPPSCVHRWFRPENTN